MSPIKKVLVLLSFLSALCASFWLGGEFARLDQQTPPAGKTDTVTVVRWLHDTVRIEVASKPAGSVVATLPVSDGQKLTTSCQNLTTSRDSATVEIPIEEKTYTGEHFRAVVRGFRPELVDIWVKQTTTTVTVPVRKRWSVTVGPQVGYGFTPAGWQPYAGVGVTVGYTF